jgi:hypothetical protein
MQSRRSQSFLRIFPDAQCSLDGIHQLCAPEWLDEECDWPSAQGKSSCLLVPVRRDQDYWESAAASAKSAAEFHAAHLRQVNIDHHARVSLRQMTVIQHLARTIEYSNVEASSRDQAPQGAKHGRIIVDDEDNGLCAIRHRKHHSDSITYFLAA